MATASFEVEINTEYRSAVRFPAWIALSIFSGAALISLAARVKSSERGSEERWALAVTSLSLIFGLLSTAAYLIIRSIFAGQLPEGAMVRTSPIGFYPLKSFPGARNARLTANHVSLLSRSLSSYTTKTYRWP